MRYLRTKLGTDNRARPVSGTSFLGELLQRIEANPDYDHSLVREWLIEFGDDELPWREIGLNDEGIPVLAGPDKQNYGFWLDTNMQYTDFVDAIEITFDQFNEQWTNWAAM